MTTPSLIGLGVVGLLAMVSIGWCQSRPAGHGRLPLRGTMTQINVRHRCPGMVDWVERAWFINEGMVAWSALGIA